MTNEELKKLLEDVPANPAKVEFPCDKWGFTSDFKKSAMKLASGIRGQQDKHDLAIACLAVIAAHIKKRFEADKAYEESKRQHLNEAVERDVQRRQRNSTVGE